MVTVESICPISSGGKLKACAVINVDGLLRINDVRVIQTPGKRPFAAMPSRRIGDHKFESYVEVIDENLRQEIADAVITEFYRLQGEGWSS